MIEFSHITKDYKTDFWKSPHLALENVSFKIEEGKITGFLGPNGAGKTTLIKLLLGLSAINSGHISHPKLGDTKKDLLSNLGYMPERPYYYPNSTGREIVNYFGKLSQVNNTDIKLGLTLWSERLGMSHAIDRKTKTYSKGMLQRIGLIAALIHSPRLLILDEPVSGMDPSGRKEIKDILKELCEKNGVTVFFSTHIIPDVEEICDRIIFLKKGKVMYDGTVKSLLLENNTGYELVYEKSNYIHQIKLNESEKEITISKIISEGGKILRLNIEGKRLEDVLYNNEKF